MRPDEGEVLHFSEDPTIERFLPHVAATAREPEAYVWAVDAFHSPSYWFPRQCPRAMAWVRPGTTRRDRERIIGAGCGERVHAIEYAWLDAMRTTVLYAYRFPAALFHPIGDPAAPHAQAPAPPHAQAPAPPHAQASPSPHAWVSTEPVIPLGSPERVGDLLACHAAAGIQLRLLDTLWPFWDRVVDSTVGFSGIRLRNAQARTSPSATG